MQEREERPPYIEFERRPVEDRAASIAEGHYVAKDVDFVWVTPSGTKDRIPRIVSEWFEQKQQEVLEKRFPALWLEKFKEAYEYWKRGEEIPLDGVSVKNWPFPSPSQVKTMIDLHVLTIEDMAAANEETIRRLGMGGMSLKQAAEAYLKMHSDGSAKLSKDMDVLRADNEALKVRNQSLEEQVQELAAQMRELKVPKEVSQSNEGMRPL